jgi:hypothetical protein
MTVRQVSHRGGNMIGHFPSLTMNDQIPFESTIERDYLYLLDYDPTVLAFAAQPLKIHYQHDGKSATYTPDFYVRFATGEALVECKHHSQVDSSDNTRKFAAARAWCEEQGWSYHIVTDQDLRKGYQLTNVKLLTYYARMTVPPRTRASIIAIVQGTSEPLTLEALISALHPLPAAQARAYILHLVFHHVLAMPLLDAPITNMTPVFISPVQA